MAYIPKWAWWVLAGAVAIALMVGASQYLDAATSLLPGGETGG